MDNSSRRRSCTVTKRLKNAIPCRPARCGQFRRGRPKRAGSVSHRGRDRAGWQVRILNTPAPPGFKESVKVGEQISIHWLRNLYRRPRSRVRMDFRCRCGRWITIKWWWNGPAGPHRAGGGCWKGARGGLIVGRFTELGRLPGHAAQRCGFGRLPSRSRQPCY